MAKTFDNISESSATNYLFLFAQRTLALQNELPTPPPLNALGLPCHAICLLWDLLQKKTDETALEATATEAIGFDKARSSVGSWSFSTGSWSFFPGSEKFAEKVTEYILNHQDDAAEEEHWRTTMKREIGKSFRIQNQKIDEQGIAMHEIGKSFRIQNKKIDEQGIAMHAKMDMTIQLVKDLAKQHHFSGD
jgi:hypothetical protein